MCKVLYNKLFNTTLSLNCHVLREHNDCWPVKLNMVPSIFPDSNRCTPLEEDLNEEDECLLVLECDGKC